jgi:hypothetical protein
LTTTAGIMAVVVACLAVYAPFLRDFFVLDDFIWLHAAQAPDPLRFLRDAAGFPEPTAYSVPTPFWRPLIDAHFFVAWRLFGMNPTPYHVANLALHAANALLLSLLVRQLTAARVPALLIGLLWAILPVYDYAVVWISEATELWATLWYFLTLIFFVAFFRSGRRLLYLGALLSMTFALLAKQSSVTIPAVLVVLALLLARPHGWPAALRTGRLLLPFVGLGFAYAAFLYQHDYRISAEAGIYAAGPHALANIWDYLLRLTWPFVPPGQHADSPASITAAVVVLMAGGAALLVRRMVLGFAFLWMLIALLPYSLFPAGTESRYLYLASAPFTVFLVLLVRDAVSRVRPVRWRVVLGGAALLALPPLCILLGRETRERQSWLHQQSRAYHQVFAEVPHLCGALPDGGRIAVVGGPMLDLFGESTRMALNLHYPRVYIERIDSVEVLVQPFTCVVRYEGGEYERVPGEQAALRDP